MKEDNNLQHQNRGKVRGCDLGKAELERCYDLLEPLFSYQAIIWQVGGEEFVKQMMRDWKYHSEDVHWVYRVLRKFFPDEMKKTMGCSIKDVVRVLLKELDVKKLGEHCCGNCKYFDGKEQCECPKMIRRKVTILGNREFVNTFLVRKNFHCTYWEKK